MALITEAGLRARLAQGIPNPFPLRIGDKLTPAAADFLKGRGIGIERTEAGPGNGSVLVAALKKEWPLIPVGVSGRHVHLSMEHVEQLFGKGYQLTPLRELSQHGQFATQETVTLVGPRGILNQVRILGPSRGASQVEISRTDGYTLGIHPPLRLSGRLEGTPGIALVGPKQTVTLPEGLIVARNHVHMPPDAAELFQVHNGESIIVQTDGERPVIFPEVTVRVSPGYSLELHIDTDEANAAQLKTGDFARCIGRLGGSGRRTGT